MGRVVRVGRDPTAPMVISSGPLQAESEGFDLHAGVAVPAGDRGRLEHLCRYVLRPPIAQEAIEWTLDDKVLLRLRRPWQDGTQAICFEPSEFLEKIAAMIPKPRLNLLVYHGVFAPNARWRCDAVRTSAGSLWSAGRAREGAEAGTTAPTGSAQPSPTASDAVVATTGATVPVGSLAGQSAPPASVPPTAATNAATAQPTPSEDYKRPTH